MAKIEVKITSGATIAQGVVAKGGAKALNTYTRNAAVIFLDSDDFNKLGIQPNARVKLSNEMNHVIVYARITPDGRHPGVAFMPRGPWCNLLILPETDSSGCPMYKNTKVSVEPIKGNEHPLDMPDLIKKYYINKL